MASEEDVDDLTRLRRAMSAEMEEWFIKYVNHEPLNITKGSKRETTFMGLPTALIVSYECEHSTIYGVEVAASRIMKDISQVTVRVRHTAKQTSAHTMECTREEADRIQNIFTWG